MESKMKYKLLRSLILYLFLPLLFFGGCGKRFEGKEYFPLATGNGYEHSGMLGKSKVTESTGDEKTEVYTLSYYDEEGKVIIYSEEYVVEEGLVLKRSFTPAVSGFTSFSFSPPLLYSPFSDQVGASQTLKLREYRENQSQEIFGIVVDYQIEKIEDVSVAAGSFEDCIKMRISYSYQDSTDVRFMFGDYFFWFAKGVGIVKYESLGGTGELLRAKIGEKRYP